MQINDDDLAILIVHSKNNEPYKRELRDRIRKKLVDRLGYPQGRCSADRPVRSVDTGWIPTRIHLDGDKDWCNHPGPIYFPETSEIVRIRQLIETL